MGRPSPASGGRPATPPGGSRGMRWTTPGRSRTARSRVRRRYPAHMTDDPLCFRSATPLAAAIRDGDAVVRRGRRGLPRPDRRGQPAAQRGRPARPDALELARRADEDSRPASRPGPLHGVPFTIKDSLDTAGVVTTAGTVGWRDRVPDRDATVVARLRAAGGILLGKTNTPEFTWSDETDNDVYGRTSNPYDLGAHARREQRRSGRDRRRRRLAVRHRQRHRRQHPPAGPRLRRRRSQADQRARAADRATGPAFTGILESLTQLGPIARRVEDLALLLPIIAGPDGEDPHVAPVAAGRSGREVVDGACGSSRSPTTASARRRPRRSPPSRPPPARSRTRARAVEERLPPGMAEAVDGLGPPRSGPTATPGSSG